MPPSTKALEEKGKILLWPVAATRALALFFIILLSSPLLLPAGFLLFSCPRLFLPFPFLRMVTLAHAKSASRPRRGIVRSSWIWKNTGGHNGVWHTGNRHNRVRPAFNKQLPIYNWWVRLLGPSARPGSREGTGWREWRRERGWMNNADKMPIRAPKRRGPCSANYLPLLMMIVLMQSPNTLPPPCNPSPCLNLTFTQLPLLLPDSPQQRERLNCFYRCTMEDFRSASKRLIKDNTIAFIYFVYSCRTLRRCHLFFTSRSALGTALHSEDRLFIQLWKCIIWLFLLNIFLILYYYLISHVKVTFSEFEFLFQYLRRALLSPAPHFVSFIWFCRGRAGRRSPSEIQINQGPLLSRFHSLQGHPDYTRLRCVFECVPSPLRISIQLWRSGGELKAARRYDGQAKRSPALRCIWIGSLRYVKTERRRGEALWPQGSEGRGTCGARADC